MTDIHLFNRYKERKVGLIFSLKTLALTFTREDAYLVQRTYVKKRLLFFQVNELKVPIALLLV